MSENGCHTFIVSSANDAKKELSLMKGLASATDGIICVSGLSELPEGVIPEEFPLVWVDRVPKSARTIPWIANDDADAMEKATGLLMKKNCRHILLLPGIWRNIRKARASGDTGMRWNKMELIFAANMYFSGRGSGRRKRKPAI